MVWWQAGSVTKAQRHPEGLVFEEVRIWVSSFSALKLLLDGFIQSTQVAAGAGTVPILPAHMPYLVA